MDTSPPDQPEPDAPPIRNLLLPVAPSSPRLKTPSKTRSFSDSIPKLSPSPKIRESAATATSKDDILIATPSRLPRRNNLSLQMPARDNIFSTAVAAGGATPPPQQEAKEPYVSPSTVLPRHSRGLDFSRASTNLHHTTSVDHSSPGSSPTMSHKGLPSRRQSNVSMMLESPKPSSMNSWLNGSNAGVFTNTRPFGPATALTSDASDSSDSDDDVIMRQEDPDEAMLTTPQARRYMDGGGGGGGVTPYGPRINSITSSSSSGYSPIARGMPHFRRQMSGTIQTRSMFGSFGDSISRVQTSHSESQSDSEHSHRGSLAATETNTGAPDSRRESLTFGAQGLRVSPTNGESFEEPAINLHPMVPSVERRPVARRSNMLPKSKGFSRIKAMLKEESSPVDSEAMREAEIVRQVRVKDVGTNGGDESPPDLTPSILRRPPTLDPSEMSDIEAPSTESFDHQSRSLKSFEDRRNSSQKEFWWLLNRGRSSSGVSDDNNMSIDLPRLSTPPPPGTSRSSTSNLQDIAEVRNEDEQHVAGGVLNAFQTPSLPSAADMSKKVSNKRRRDDDWDPASIKRRAVSPGMSVASSPVMGHSPVSNSSPWWGQKNNGTNVVGGREGSGSSAGREERAGSVISMGGVTPTLGPKRVGLKGMSDTNDGLMKMSIE